MVGRAVWAAGVLAAIRQADTRNGGAMEFMTLEDETGIFEVTLFPGVYGKYRHLIEDSGPYLIFGTVEENYGAVTVNAQKVCRLQAERCDSDRDTPSAAAPGRPPSRRAACEASETR